MRITTLSRVKMSLQEGDMSSPKSTTRKESLNERKCGVHHMMKTGTHHNLKWTKHALVIFMAFRPLYII